jgi:hypothetical protein
MHTYHICRKLVETALNKNVKMAGCLKICGDIFESSHCHKRAWASASSSGGERDCNPANFVDAQGIMLVLQRVRNLSRQGMYDASCRKRARAIKRTIKGICKHELGDMSLEGFNTKQRLAEIEQDYAQRRAERNAVRRTNNIEANATAAASGGAAAAPQQRRKTYHYHDGGVELLRSDVIHGSVPGLLGKNTISRVVGIGKPEFLLRWGFSHLYVLQHPCTFCIYMLHVLVCFSHNAVPVLWFISAAK